MKKIQLNNNNISSGLGTEWTSNFWVILLNSHKDLMRYFLIIFIPIFPVVRPELRKVKNLLRSLTTKWLS